MATSFDMRIRALSELSVEQQMTFAEIILYGRWLRDEHIDAFGTLLKGADPQFAMQDTWKVQIPDEIQAVSPNAKYIQILHSCEDFRTNRDGHWICAYYDTNKILIYDSLNKKKLHRHHELYLRKLFPFYPTQNVEFRPVQQQSNGSDCGVFAIAFAISILHGQNPENVSYTASEMRRHLIKIFETNILEHFPCSIQLGSLKVQNYQSNLASEASSKCQESNAHAPKGAKKQPDIILRTQKSLDSEKKSNFKPYSSQSFNNNRRSKQSTTIAIERLNSKNHNKSINEANKKLSLKNSKQKANLSVKGMKKMTAKPPGIVESNIKQKNNTSKVVQKANLSVKGMKKMTAKPPVIVESNIKQKNSTSKVVLSSVLVEKNGVVHNQSSKSTEKIVEMQLVESFTHDINGTKTALISSESICDNHKMSHDSITSDLANKKIVIEQGFKEGVNQEIFLDLSSEPNEKSICARNILDDSSMKNPKESEKSECSIGKNSVSIVRCDKYVSSNESMEYSSDSIISSTQSSMNSTVTNADVVSALNKLKERRKLKWQTRKDRVNKLRREKYDSRSNKRKREVRDFYNTNREDICAKNRIKYANDLENNRAKKRIKYSNHLEENRAQQKIKYSNNLKENRARKRINYALNASNNRDKKRVRYTALKEQQKERKAFENKKYYTAHKTSITARRKITALKKITQKYGSLRSTFVKTDISMLREFYVVRVAETINKTSVVRRMEAEWIIKWCYHIRDKYIYEIKKGLECLREKAEVCLTQLSACVDAKIEDKIYILCGSVKQHTASSEGYFAEAIYNQPLQFTEAIIMNESGKAINILPITYGKKDKISWDCTSLCKEIDDIDINRYKNFLEKIMNSSIKNVLKIFSNIHECTVPHYVNKLGHSQVCYVFPTKCRSLFLSVQLLSSHFEKVRVMRRLFYKVWSILKKFKKLDEALESNNTDFLRAIALEAQQNSKSFEATNEIELNEDIIMSTHSAAFKLFTKCSTHAPRYVCGSCEKLCFRKDVAEIKNLRTRITSVFWRDLIKHVQKEDTETPEYICHYCLDKFRSNKLPPTCILNQLVVGEVPKVISDLNDYEKLLIQRAKAFQIVQKMGTVAKKNQPHRQMNSKVIGRTFHLPLPMEETLKKICPSTEPLNLEHELYILVRGIPTKAKIVWENLVDIKKVFNALAWLKENNKLYSEINLPDSADMLLDKNIQDVEFQVQADNDIDIEKVENNVENIIIDKVDENKAIQKAENKPRAFLTQVSESSEYYEQFTVHPMYPAKENRTATDLYQMLKIQDLALPHYYKFLDLKCFPDLFPYGVNGQHEDRSIRLTDFEFLKSKLMSKHSQFRLNQQYLFFALNDNNIRQLNSGIFHKMNVINPRERFSAAGYLQQLAKGELEGNLNTIFSRLRNTEQFWRKPRCNLNCMIHNYGPATWFITLSPSEFLWSDLIEYLREVNPSIAHMSANALIAADPISVSRFIDNKFRAMLAFICSKSNVIGEVTHYFWRREYQTRGTQHFHMLIWIKDAPILGESPTEEIANFILKYATCRMPVKNISPMLHRRVSMHQNHNHNSYCMRTKKVKSRTTRACRFGFPRPTCNTLVMRDVATAVAGRRQLKSKSRLYDLPRSQEEKCINDYNPALLTVWEGNMDIQFVGEKSSLLNWYCTKYISKAEKSYISETFEQINSTKSLTSRLWNIGLRMLCNRECGAPEAADSLLGLSLYGTDPSTTIRWIDVNIIRSRKVKPFKEIQAMDGESTDIFCPNLTDYYYPTRPVELSPICLYDFAKWYDIVTTRPKREVEFYELSDGKFLKRREKPYLINHYRNDVNTQPEKYFFALLLLFQPWREVDELRNGRETYAESFASIELQLTNALKYHERLTEIKENLERAKDLIEKELAANAEQEKKNDDDCDMNGIPLGCEPIEADDAMKDLKEIADKDEIPNVTQMISELNIDQKRIFDKVVSTTSSDQHTLRLYVSGEGGTGKSFLIKTIRCWIKQILGKDTAVTAPTGIAAFGINGITVHRLFQLPVEHGQTPKYKALSDVVLKVLRDQLKNVTLIIIDEVSMISNVSLLYIHLRLTEIFNTSDVDDGWFGKKHILLFGDLLQLPPVREEPAFIKLSTSKAETLLDSLGSSDIWAALFSYDELTINMRQRNDCSYREMLSRVRLGFVTAADSRVLESRKINFASTEFADRIEELCDYITKLPLDTVCLLPTCHLCDVLNEAMINRIHSEEIQLIAQDTVECARYHKKKALEMLSRDNADTSCTAGVARVINIKIGAKVMLRRNIDVTLGLVNGTIGTIVSVTRAIDTNDVEKITILITTGAQYELERVSVKFQVMDRVYAIRKQFPLCLSYGITIHKSQGLSLKNAVIDAGNSIFSCGQVYVALSRVTSLEGLHLINYDPHSVKADESSVLEYNRLRQLYRPDLAQMTVSKERGRKVPDIVWAVSKHITDCQQLHDSKAGNNSWQVHGLQNTDGVSCYANANIQCIFNCQIIREKLLKSNTPEDEDALVSLLRAYIDSNNELLNTLGVRQFVGEPFIENIQQDAATFLMALCSKSDTVKTAVEHKLITKIRCKACEYTATAKEQPSYVLSLTIPMAKKPLTLQETIDYNLSQWRTINGQCDRCSDTNCIIKTDVSMAKEVLILQLVLMSINKESLKKYKEQNYSIKAVPTSTVTICRIKYKVKSAVFHHGSAVDEGHYTSMLRYGTSSWILAHDRKIDKKSWPRNAKDSYIFFLEQNKKQ